MRNTYTTKYLFPLVAAIVLVSGCSSSDLAPVSGTVTYEGEPVGKLSICFSPEPVGDNFAVGPYSKATTDSDGKFALKTRNDEDGAFIGKHKITLKYTDISESDISDLHYLNATNKAKAKKLQAKIEKKLAGRPFLTGTQEIFDIPAGGHEDLKIELSEILIKN